MNAKPNQQPTTERQTTGRINTTNHLAEADRQLSTAIERIQQNKHIPKGIKIILEDELKHARKHVANGRIEQTNEHHTTNTQARGDD